MSSPIHARSQWSADAGAAPDPCLPPDFESFFEVSLDLLVIRDSDLRIRKVNRAWERVLGYRRDELEGQPMLSFIHPDDVRPSHDQMIRAVDEKDVDGFINRYRCRDGSYRIFEWRAHQHGELVYGMARDVTERTAMEAEMSAARVDAEAANTSKSEFLANMSHEVRTPLNGVIGVAAALVHTDLSVRQREMVELILSSGHTLERVVSDVLDFSKIEAGRLEFDIQPFNLRPEMDGLLDLFRVRAEEKGLRFLTSYGPGASGRFLGDVVRIKQVLGNLLSNAIKFTAEGQVRARIEVRGSQAAGPAELHVEVQDSGIGFDDAFARKLFQRFSQADGSITRRFGGTGLGLSICQALVQLMGGEILAASEPGRGSQFDLMIPLTRSPDAGMDGDPVGPRHAEASLVRGEGEAARGPRILLAEDHVINQRVVELILGPVGAQLVVAENGEDAVSLFAETDFDLVLMDMQMPVMDGLAATRAIRAFEASIPGRRRTPVVMLSANAMRQHSEDAVAAGADLHLSKPVTAASLLAAVTRALSPIPEDVFEPG
jgi:PAS domain S-box-containing protein